MSRWTRINLVMKLFTKPASTTGPNHAARTDSNTYMHSLTHSLMRGIGPVTHQLDPILMGSPEDHGMVPWLLGHLKLGLDHIQKPGRSWLWIGLRGMFHVNLSGPYLVCTRLHGYSICLGSRFCVSVGTSIGRIARTPMCHYFVNG